MSEQLIEERVRYEEQIRALPCVSKRTKIYSLSGTVQSGNQARILLDNYQNGILETKDCYLNFVCNPVFKGTNIAGDTTADQVRDPTKPTQHIPIFRNLNTAACLIQKVEVLVNGVSICVMDNYNMINQVLTIAGNDPTNSGYRGLCQGGDASHTVLTNTGTGVGTSNYTPPAAANDPFATTAVGGANDKDIASLKGENFTYVVGANVGTAGVLDTLTGKPQAFSLPLHSILGSCFKNIPLGYLQNSGLEIQVTFENDGLKAFHTLNPKCPLTSVKSTFTNVNFDCRVNYYEPASMDVINEFNGWKQGGEPITWCGTQFKCSTGQVTINQQDTTNDLTTLVPNSRYRCLDNMFYAAFPSTAAKAPSDATGATNLGGINPWLPFIGCDSIQYRIGSTLVPRTAINKLSDVVEGTQACRSAVTQSLANTYMCRYGTYMNDRQDASGIAAASGASDRTSDNGNQRGYVKLFPRGVVGVVTGTFNDAHDNISGTDTSNLSVQCLTRYSLSTAGYNSAAPLDAPANKNALAPQETAWISQITVAYQLDPTTGRMGVSF